MDIEQLKNEILKIIENKKGIDSEAIDVREYTTIADLIIISEGSSSRHVKALTREIISGIKKIGIAPISSEGLMEDSSWAIIDYGAIIVHVMDEAARKKFKLEEFWKIEIKKIKKMIEI